MLENLFDINWSEIFIPQISLLEMFVRGTLVYFLLFAFLRLFRKKLGAIGITDVLVLVLVADATQNAIASDYKSITEAAVLVGSIAFWDYLLDYLGYKSEFFARVVRPQSLDLIKDGELNRENMRKEMITVEELESQLRQQGIENFEDVKQAKLEGDGNISFIEVESNDDDESSENNSQNRPSDKAHLH